MKNLILTLLCFITTCVFSQTQDTIITKNKRVFIGEIYKIDTINKQFIFITNQGNSVILSQTNIKYISNSITELLKPTTATNVPNISLNKDTLSDISLNNLNEKIDLLQQDILSLNIKLNNYYFSRKKARLKSYEAFIVGLLSGAIISYGVGGNYDPIIYAGGMLGIISCSLSISSTIQYIKAERYLKK